MRLASLAVVALCVAGLALAAPQLAFDESPLSAPFGDGDADEPDYGPVEGSYFRAASYDRYTGSGWERTASTGSTAGLEPPPAAAETVRISYEVESPVRTLPAPWRPTGYDGPEASTQAGSLTPDRPLGPGDTFTVTSRRPVWSESDLRTAGTNYPDGLERRYTRLPEDTPEELASTAAEVTADAETPYEKSVAVNRWLRTEKNYSLTVDQPDGDVATAFATEMDAGYCQYFATTMAAMLRAEGVPARYVSGYTPYEQVGPGEHVVRGKYAHTWVEVYFPEVGWVPFDPTPPTDRQAARGLETAETGDDAGTAGGNGGEAAFVDVRPSLSVQDDDQGWRQLDADIAVDPEPAPGEAVTVTVSDPDDGSAVPGAQVRFNGRPIGETDDAGEVVAEVPYADELRVTAHVYDGDGEPPPVRGGGTGGSGTGATAESESLRDLRYAGPRTEVSGSLTGLSDAVLFRATVEEGAVLRRGEPAAEVDDPGPDRQPNGTDARGDDRPAVRAVPDALAALEEVERVRLQSAGSERTFDLETSIDVSLDPGDESHPRDPLEVTATIDGRPVPNATVTAGEVTATTDAEGRTTIPTPYERPATVVVERGDARGEGSVAVVGSLSVAVDEGWTAGAPVTVTATVDGRPVPDATVTNGVETARTDGRGVATIPAPYRSPGEITVERGDFSRTVERPVTVGEPRVSVDDPVPGREVLVRGAVGSEPIRNAVVSLDGTPTGDTDRFGRGRVTLPYDETVTVSVSRGDVGAERTVDVPTDVTVETEGRAVPGGSVDLLATVEGEPVENATVYANGEAVDRTGADGRATVDVPLLAGTLDLAVSRGDASGDARAGHVWLYWAGLLGVLTVVGAAARRRGHLDRLPRRPSALVALAAATIAGLVDRLLADLERTLETRDAGATPAAGGGGDGSGAAFLVDPAADNDVYRAWTALAAGLEGTQRTPAAVADRAVEAGLPEEPVAELTELFREVRYGDAEPTAERERRAEAALSRIREATE